MPEVDEQLAALAGGSIFTTLDLSKGFLQIPLTEETKEKSAFVTENITAKFERKFERRARHFSETHEYCI